VRGSLQQVTEEMDTAFASTAFSPVICDAWDRASGIYDSSGDVVVQGVTGLPLFIGTMQFTVKAVLAVVEDIAPGDVFIVNDPYAGGTHLMDVKMVAPIFHDAECILFLANTGHWPDVGGRSPGGFTTQSTDTFQEGVRIPPLRLIERGRVNSGLVELLLANVRGLPRDRRGDIEAQLNALALGARRLEEVIGRYGWNTIQRVIHELAARSERLMREHIAALPDGTYEASDFLDNDGIRPDPVRISLNLTIEGDEMHFDFSATDPPTLGPFNAPLSTTLTSCYIAVKHIFPEIPINAGCFRPLKFNVPATTLLNPTFPRPVAGCTTEVPQRIIDVVFQALVQAAPERVPASAFSTGSNYAIAGTDRVGAPFAFVNYTGGGYGGSAFEDGLINGATTISVARVASIEVLEQRFPVRYVRYGIREGSAGPGRHRGGFGTVVEVEMLCSEATFSLLGDRAHHAPRGALGGGPGAPARHTFFQSGIEWVPPSGAKVENLQLREGDRVLMETPGGGGFGDPSEREEARVAADIKAGYLTAELAAAQYGKAKKGG